MKKRGSFRRKKARNVLQGFEQGSNSLFNGFANGLTSVIMHPYKGAKQQGSKGLFKGIVKGAVGLFFKPISGIFDTVSKSAEVREDYS